MEKKKVIIDCDPGIDDALAIMLALRSKELEVVGITIVCGNVPTSMGVENALKVLNLMGNVNIPVYLGESKPLERELVTAQDTHGEDGLGETNYSSLGKANEGAIDFILDTLHKEKDLTVIALGPLTNISKALMKDKDAFKNLKELITMGGAFKSHGNTSPVAEFNYWVDPHGANYVYNNLKAPIHMVGLDVTRKIVLTPNLRELMKQFNNPLGDFINDITRFYVDFHWKAERTLGCVINDPLAVAYTFNRELCSGINAYVQVVEDGVAMGQSMVDVQGILNKPANTYVLTEVNHKEFMKLFLSAIFPGNIDDINRVLEDEIYGK